MSRAFVKEPDGDAVADDAPELPQSPHPNYVTPLGLAQIEARLAALEQARRRLRAGGEDLANKLPLAHIERELRWVACASNVPFVSTPRRSRRTGCALARASRSRTRTGWRAASPSSARTRPMRQRAR